MTRRGRRTTALVVAAVLLAAVAVGGYVLWGALEDQEYPHPAIAAVDAQHAQGRSQRITGVIEVVDVDLLNPWGAILNVRTADGRTVIVAVNRYSRLQTAGLPRRNPAERGDPFPYEVLGFRFDGTARRVGLGIGGLQRWWIVEAGTIRHP